MFLKKSLLQKPFYIISSSSNLSHPCTYLTQTFVLQVTFSPPPPNCSSPLNFVLLLVTKTPTRHSRETTTWSNDKQQIDVEHKNGPHMWSLIAKFLSVANNVFFRKEIHLSSEQGPLLVSGIICNSIVSGMIQEQCGQSPIPHRQCQQKLAISVFDNRQSLHSICNEKGIPKKNLIQYSAQILG